ncbi:hypothetical protein QZH41_009563 [Actinostola sp. cb2023]|nr:hypothetical protein QZH41_009563 [Actinostola sp. cb2023]
MINGEDPVITEIEALEARNQELDEGLQSYKRSNEHLNNQVNEQRKQILHFQDQIKRERTELANRQLLEQRTLKKEQLEVHIQTIGILVGEKQELQSSLSQLQRKFVNKESENSELTGRLQAVRQKIVELEKSNASLSANLDKYKEDYHHVRQERDRYQTSNYTHGKNKEELLQQIEELKVKLDVKVSENEGLVKSNGDISFKLTQAELIVQQVNIVCWQVIKTLYALETEKKDWENREMELQENMQALHIQLGEIQDDDAMERQEATSMVAAQIERLSEQKQQLVDHLQNEALENAKLKKLENKYLQRIHELELNLNRLEEDATDTASLLESVQSDKETISRALKQNKELKEKLEQIEDRFVKLTNDNMDLTNQRDTEKHVARELAIKLSETAVELEEIKDKLSQSENELSSRIGEFQSIQEQVEYLSVLIATTATVIIVIIITTTIILITIITATTNVIIIIITIIATSTTVNIIITIITTTIITIITSSTTVIIIITIIATSLSSSSLNGSSSEVDSLRTEHELSIQRIKEQLAHKDFELSSLREEVSTSSQRLEVTQAQSTDYYKQYEEQSQKMQSIYQHLEACEDTISQLASENKHLRTILDTRNDTVSDRSDTPSSSDEQHEQHTPHHNGESHTKDDEISDDDSLQIKGRLSSQDTPSSGTPDIKMSPDGSYINGDNFDGTKEDTDSSEEMDMAPREHRGIPHQISKYTSREDVMEGLSVSIRQLEMERDQLTHLLHSYQETHQNELQRLQDHLELQLQQQLQQQYRQVQEQFQQTLHEQQQKIVLLQEVLQKQKAQIEKQSEEEDLTNQSVEDGSVPYEALNVAFSKLQVRFKDLMDEKAALQDRVQELEHLTDQLSFETETIEEYVTLYQTQRSALKSYYNEREQIITQLSNEKGDMQNKISQLQSLVKQLIEERQILHQQQHQLQNIVNKRMLAHEHENVIPAYHTSDASENNEESLKTDKDSSFILDSSLDSGRESPLQMNDLESVYQTKDDGTTRQILQLLEQLGPTDEGGERGWLSPTVRSRDFLPCRYCTGSRLIQI